MTHSDKVVLAVLMPSIFYTGHKEHEYVEFITHIERIADAHEGECSR